MAEFMENIWLSIFTAGPTPTLIVATNAAFAALQLVLAALLWATYSVHFIVLSFLCGGLWWSINWFAREVMAVQAEEEAKKARGESSANLSGIMDDHGGMDSGDDTDGTELDKIQVLGGAEMADSDRSVNTSTAAELAPALGVPLRRRAGVTDSPGELSTDSEWEKVDK